MTFRIDDRVIGVGEWEGSHGLVLEGPKGGWPDQDATTEAFYRVMWIGEGVGWVSEARMTHDPHAGERCSCGVVGRRTNETQVMCENEACEVIAFRRSA